MAAPKNASEAKPANDTGLLVIIVLIIIFVILFGFAGLNSFSDSSASKMGYSLSVIERFITFLFSRELWSTLGIISVLSSIFLISVIVFCLIRMREIQNHEKEEIAHEVALALARDAEEEQKENPRWRYVLGLIESPSESDWRMAILEADSMLDDLMTERGYSGESLGEKLTAARADAFLSLDNAWEAHTIRNKIAHSGSDFPFSQMESRRTMRLYETVFEEFNYI